MILSSGWVGVIMISVSVCLSSDVSQRLCVQSSQKLLCTLLVAVADSFNTLCAFGFVHDVTFLHMFTVQVKDVTTVVTVWYSCVNCCALSDRIGGTSSWSTYSRSSWLLAHVFWRPIVAVSRTLRDLSTCRTLRHSTNTSFWLSLNELKHPH